MGRKQRGYPVKVKLATVELVELIGLPAAVKHLGYPHGTVHGWWQARAKLRAFQGNKLGKTTKGQGRKEIFPFTPALITFMKDTRRDEEWLTTASMIGFIQQNYEDWLNTYVADKKSEESSRRSLERLLQRTASRYGFSTQKAQETKLHTVDLQRMKTEFAVNFWNTYSTYAPAEIYNVDETAIQFDMPPARTWAVKGRKGSAKVQDFTKHCGRMTAVLTIRADGKKLPILFILRGKLGGAIDSNELSTLPKGHFYTVQEAGWMDAVGWKFYVDNLLKYEIDAPALLLADNFNCHVSEEGVRVVAEEACATVVPLPPKSTSVCQPLDVGVMGPLKARIRGQYVPKRGLSAAQKRLRAIKATISAWESFPSEHVISSFKIAIPLYESTTV